MRLLKYQLQMYRVDNYYPTTEIFRQQNDPVNIVDNWDLRLWYWKKGVDKLDVFHVNVDIEQKEMGKGITWHGRDLP
jgi:hypothetical protein